MFFFEVGMDGGICCYKVVCVPNEVARIHTHTHVLHVHVHVHACLGGQCVAKHTRSTNRTCQIMIQSFFCFFFHYKCLVTEYIYNKKHFNHGPCHYTIPYLPPTTHHQPPDLELYIDATCTYLGRMVLHNCTILSKTLVNAS